MLLAISALRVLSLLQNCSLCVEWSISAECIGLFFLYRFHASLIVATHRECKLNSSSSIVRFQKSFCLKSFAIVRAHQENKIGLEIFGTLHSCLRYKIQKEFNVACQICWINSGLKLISANQNDDLLKTRFCMMHN